MAEQETGLTVVESGGALAALDTRAIAQRVLVAYLASLGPTHPLLLTQIPNGPGCQVGKQLVCFLCGHCCIPCAGPIAAPDPFGGDGSLTGKLKLYRQPAAVKTPGNQPAPLLSVMPLSAGVGRWYSDLRELQFQ